MIRRHAGSVLVGVAVLAALVPSAARVDAADVPITLYAGTDNENFNGTAPPDRIAVVQLNGTTVEEISIIETPYGINGVVASGQGTFYAGEPLAGELREIALDGSEIRTFPSPLADGCCGEDMAFDGTDIWRGHYGLGRIYRFATDGTAVAEYPLPGVVGVEFVGGELWASIWSPRRVGTYDLETGTFMIRFATSSAAGALAYDPDNHVMWVGTLGGAVEAWDLDTLMPVPGSRFEPFGRLGNTIDGLTFGCAERGFARLRGTPAEGVASNTIHTVAEPLLGPSGLRPAVHQLNCGRVVPVEEMLDRTLP